MAEVNNSLMKKTKADLVNIILRKDDVEIKLKEEIQQKEVTISDLQNAIDENSTNLVELKERNAVLLTNMKQDLNDAFKEVCLYKQINIILGVISIMLFIITAFCLFA